MYEDQGERPPRGRPARSRDERRTLELTIAREALRLFLLNGPSVTTVAQIASASGVSLRTFWRHFRSKESAIRPFLDDALDDSITRMSQLTPGTTLSEGWAGESRLDDDALGALVDLVRMVQYEPALRAVWLEAHHAAATAFVPLLARHLSLAPDGLEAQVASAELNAALATALEHYTLRNVEGLSLNETIRRAVRLAID